MSTNTRTKLKELCMNLPVKKLEEPCYKSIIWTATIEVNYNQLCYKFSGKSTSKKEAYEKATIEAMSYFDSTMWKFGLFRKWQLFKSFCWQSLKRLTKLESKIPNKQKCEQTQLYRDALVGDAAMDLALILLGYNAGLKRGEIDTLRQRILNNKVLANGSGPLGAAKTEALVGSSVISNYSELESILRTCIGEELNTKILNEIKKFKSHFLRTDLHFCPGAKEF